MNSSLINKTYVKFLLGFVGIILLGFVVILIVGNSDNSLEIDETDVNFANTEEPQFK